MIGCPKGGGILAEDTALPGTYTIYPKHQLIVLSFDGVFAPTEAEQITKAYISDPDFDPSYEQIIDLTGVTEIDAKFREMDGFVNNTATHVQELKRKRCVLIAVSNVVYGMARMYQQLATDKFPYEVIIVRSEHSALAELDIAGASLLDLNI